MLRTTALPAVLLPATLLLGLTILSPTTANAAGETCQGQPATIVGAPDVDELRGTEGPDVVVTNGAGLVRTLGGDDLVCVSGGGNGFVDVGEGNDAVDRSQETSEFTTTILGAGSDRFLGSAAGERRRPRHL